MEITGNLIMKGETQTFGNNGFRKRECAVKTNEQYPQSILIEFVQDKCDLLNNVALGAAVKISVNLRGREWINPQGETKYFNSIQGWRIEGAQGSQHHHPDSNSAVDAYQAQRKSGPETAGDDFLNGDYKSQAYQGPGDFNGTDEDDLPF